MDYLCYICCPSKKKKRRRRRRKEEKTLPAIQHSISLATMNIVHSVNPTHFILILILVSTHWNVCTRSAVGSQECCHGLKRVADIPWKCLLWLEKQTRQMIICPHPPLPLKVVFKTMPFGMTTPWSQQNTRTVYMKLIMWKMRPQKVINVR